MNKNGDWRKILGVPEKTVTGEKPDCTNCGAECDKEKKSGWICGFYKDGSLDERQMMMEI